jgi:hypothetical protein
VVATNCKLAERAQQLARGADGLRRWACLVVFVACPTTTTLTGARQALEQVGPHDVRKAPNRPD